MKYYEQGATILGHGGSHGGGHHGAGGGWGSGGWLFPAVEVDSLADELDAEDMKAVEADRLERAIDIVKAARLSRNATIVGAFDIATEQRRFNDLKQTPVSVAQILLSNGQSAINRAMQLAKDKNLPNQNTLNTNYYKLQWHQTELAKYAATPAAIYPSGADLQKWVMEAFINSNATDDGAAWIGTAWSAMWADIGRAIAALPTQVRKAVVTAVEGVLGVPMWALIAGGIGVIGLVGYGVYKFAAGPTGAAAASAYLGRGR